MRVLERQLLLARLRGNLTDEAITRIIPGLVRDGISPDAQSIRDGLLLAVGNARPRSRLVPWHLPDAIVERMVGIVAEALARKEGQQAA